MAGASEDGEANHWPAFVDVLTAVIMVVTFLLVIMSAAIMHLDHYGLAVGKRASLVVLDAGNKIEAVRLRAERLCVVARGKVVAERPRRDTTLSLPGRPAGVNRRHKTPLLGD